MAEKSTEKAEKAPPKKRSTASARQQTLETYAQTLKDVEDRGDADAKPEDKIQAKAVREAIATADALSTEGVVKSIGELRATVGKTLAQLSDRLEEEVAKYVQIQRAILAKEAELKEIYDIQKNASTLTALIEAQQRRREEFEAELARDREELTSEIETARSEWESERKSREAEQKEFAVAEQKKRDREREEYRYAFSREQQLAKDKFADETAKTEKVLTERTAEAERQLAERERAVAEREQELTDLRARVDSAPKELESAVARAIKETTDRARTDAAAREELLKREFAGERNVLSTRIAALEQTVKEQSEQITRFAAQAEKAYAQVQEIAVRAIEGSSAAKSLASLQQLYTDQPRRVAQEK
jgi:hypothetical protein